MSELQHRTKRDSIATEWAMRNRYRRFEIPGDIVKGDVFHDGERFSHFMFGVYWIVGKWDGNRLCVMKDNPVTCTVERWDVSAVGLFHASEFINWMEPVSSIVEEMNQ